MFVTVKYKLLNYRLQFLKYYSQKDLQDRHLYGNKKCCFSICTMKLVFKTHLESICVKGKQFFITGCHQSTSYSTIQSAIGHYTEIKDHLCVPYFCIIAIYECIHQRALFHWQYNIFVTFMISFFSAVGDLKPNSHVLRIWQSLGNFHHQQEAKTLHSASLQSWLGTTESQLNWCW